MNFFVNHLFEGKFYPIKSRKFRESCQYKKTVSQLIAKNLKLQIIQNNKISFSKPINCVMLHFLVSTKV